MIPTTSSKTVPPAARAIRALSSFALAALVALGGPPRAQAQDVDVASARVSTGGPDRAATRLDPSFFGGLSFRYVGPSRGGRVTAVEGHPAHPHTFYMGATGGGVWKTTDYGMSWENISDGFFATPSIGHIEVADSDPDVVYVGTGSDGLRSNVIVGKGVYKSTDAGRTWTHVGLADAGQIGAVKAHPSDPDLVYAAAIGNPFARGEARGVYRSRDGGARWDRVLFTSDSVGAVDLEFHPGDPAIIYAALWRAERKPWTIISGARAEDGIWKSTDGGDTWRRITAGLPPGLIGKIDFAVSSAAPDRVYALVEAPEPLEGLYRSDDAGETWELVNGDPSGLLMHRPFYFTNVTADPTDADVVYVNNLSLWKSSDGGRTFAGTIPTPHGDNHDLWINPDDPRIMIQSNDGGASVTLDGGRTWSPVNNQPTAELYQVDVDDRFPYWLYAGQQDDSYTVAVPSQLPAVSGPGGPDAFWRSPGGCETGPAVPKPGDPDIVYTNCKGRFGVYNARTGQEQQYYVGAVNLYGTNPADLPYRFQRVVPIEVSPHDPNTVYHGSQYVHRTTDGGRTWEQISPDLTAFRPERQMVSGTPITRDATGEEHYSTLYVIEASPHDPRVIWTGANDGPVFVTLDGGATWENVTPRDMPPEGRINSIDISRHDPDVVYVAAYRFLLGDFHPYVWRTEDAGETWTLLTDGANGIPADYPVRVVREDPDRRGLLYAGTEFGLFISFDDGASWQSFQLDLPVTPITDIEVYRQDLALSTMGRGFWVLDDVTRLHQIGLGTGGEALSGSSTSRLFRPRPQYRVRPFRNSGFEWSSPAAPEYPGQGAHIDYWIAPGLAPTAEVRIDILDPAGAVVRRYVGSDGEAVPPPPAGMRRMAARSTPGRLARTAGAHRLRWDLEAAGVGRGGGPLVAPATYTVRLTAGDVTSEAPLEIRIDPRVAAEGVTVAHLEEQHRFERAVRETLARARDVSADLETLSKRIEEAREGAEGAAVVPETLARDARELDARLNDAEGSYPQPMLISQIRYLLNMVSSADQVPGAEAYARHEALLEEVEAAEGQFESLRERAGTIGRN